MGQYWMWLNLTKGECLSAHELGAGIKYLEQLQHGVLYAALMLLCTDNSSLGDGGGDPRIDSLPRVVQDILNPIIGRWSGDKIAFAGDYSHKPENHLFDEENDSEKFQDISLETAKAVWAFILYNDLCDTIDPASRNSRIVKQIFIEWLDESFIDWEDKASVKAIFELIDETEDSEETKQAAPTEETKQAAPTEETKQDDTGDYLPNKVMRTSTPSP